MNAVVLYISRLAMFIFCDWKLAVIALSLHCASSQSKGLFNKNLTIVGEHWEPFFVIEEHSDGTETYRFVENLLPFWF